MGVNASRVQSTPDYDAGMVLREGDESALAATTIGTPVSLKELRNAIWDNYEIPHGKFQVEVEVTSLDVAGTNAYSIDLVVDDVVGMNDTPVQVASVPVTATGVYRMVVDSKSIPVLDPDHSGTDKWLASRATMSGNSTPEIQYRARITKFLGA